MNGGPSFKKKNLDSNKSRAGKCFIYSTDGMWCVGQEHYHYILVYKMFATSFGFAGYSLTT